MNRKKTLPWLPRLVYGLIMRVHIVLQRVFKQRYNRFLPLSDELIDRWARARAAGFGEGSSVYDSSYIYSDVSVGKNCWIGPFTILDGSGGLTIGDRCTIAAGVHIYSHDTIQRTLGNPETAPEESPVVIENNCYIGAGAIILQGVTVGHHSVIGAQSLVKKSLPPYSIAVGTPARIVGKVHIDGSGARLEYL